MGRPDPKEVARTEGWAMVRAHPLFEPMATSVMVAPDRLSAGALATITANGLLRVNRELSAAPEEWAWVFAHCLLHLGFGHHDPAASGGERLDPAHQAACDIAVNRFLARVRIGRAPVVLPELPPGGEESLARRWRDEGVPERFRGCGVAGNEPDLVPGAPTCRDPDHYPQQFALGLSTAVTAAVEVAGGARRSLSGERGRRAPWDLALSWFVGNYPLLGSLAARMTLVADADLARREGISVAAVDEAAGEIYVNPLASLSEEEWRFVLAHEMLHAGLRHGARTAWRDPYLWNVAADFVVNGWLVEMAIGQLPSGVLHDPQLRGLSVEAVYERITTDARRFRKLATLRGRGLGDVLGEPLPRHGERHRATDLDEFYRRALTTGLARMGGAARGMLPVGLVAAIKVLDHPEPPWDVRLARWFDEHVRVEDPIRSYARPSRRQASSPDIPRPGRYWPESPQRRGTFGVVLDTSGSMSHRLLGKALGAVAAFASARDVPAARVVFCDAAAYDGGYLHVSEIADRVRVRGRGGTLLQPGIDLLEAAEDFPADGPVLVITDGYCDAVRVRREHAFLVPPGARLPFQPRGPVFRMT